jgi:hypothetical protein
VIVIEWEPTPEGVSVDLMNMDTGGVNSVALSMVNVHELRDDMEEAAFLARGFDKVETFVSDIEPGDQIRLLGNNYTVNNLLRGGNGWVVQFEPNEHYDAVCELTLPPDMQVTVYRHTGA